MALGSSKIFSFLLAGLLLVGAGSDAAAQTAIDDASREEALALQAQLFEQLRRDPDNLDLMAEYARLSIRLEDYEPAISTLERMLIYRQDLPQVRRELGVAYFNIGSYEAARLYLNQVKQAPDLPPAVEESVDLYLAEIGRRTSTHRIALARVGAGFLFSTNANFGPEAIETGQSAVFGLGSPGDDGATEDFGYRVFGNFVHDYDLQTARSDFWRTEASGLILRFHDVGQGNVGFINVRTGPELSLDEDDFGPKIRPFFDVSYLSADDANLYVEAGLGAEVKATLSPKLAAFGEVSTRFRNFLTEFSVDRPDGSDAFRVLTSGGLAYVPRRDLVLRGALFAEQEIADAAENTNTEFGVRLSAEYGYEPGFSWVNQKWSVAGSLSVHGRLFPGNQVTLSVGPDDLVDGRRDLDIAAGVSHIFGITENFAIQADISGLFRDSSNETFDLDSVTFGLSALYQL